MRILCDKLCLNEIIVGYFFSKNLENGSLEKCFVSYQFITLKLFHPEQRNFDQNNMRFLDTREKILLLIFEIQDCSFFSISLVPALKTLAVKSL